MDVTEICRICLKKTENMILVFNTINEIDEERNQLVENIMKEKQIDEYFASMKDLTINEIINTFNVDVDGMTDTDGFPDKVCVDCIKDLCLAYLFRLRYNNAYYKIKKLLQQEPEEDFNADDISSHDCDNSTDEIFLDEYHQKIEELEYQGVQGPFSSPGSKNNIECTNFAEDIQAKYLKSDSVIDVVSSYNDDNDELVEVYQVVDHIGSESEDSIPKENIEEENREMIECRYCTQKFKNVYDCARHTTNHKIQKRYENYVIQHHCPQCEKTFKLPNQLFRHIIINHLNPPYKCDVCKKEFNLKGLFFKHRSLHYSRENLPLYLRKKYEIMNCEHCNREFIKQTHFLAHRDSCKARKMQKFPCEICSQELSSKNNLERHIVLVHKKTNECNSCGMKFNSNRDLNEHSKEHASERPFLCSECGLRFKDKRSLGSHMVTHSDERPFKCPHCEMSFKRSNLLSIHKRNHSDETPFKCNTCGKAFKHRKRLIIHTRIHTGERPYKCNFCDKGFAQSNDLKVHIRRHTGERFKCKHCDKNFIQLYLLRRHLKTGHGIQDTL